MSESKIMERLSSLETRQEDVCEKVDKGFSNLNKRLDNLNIRLDEQFVTQHEFKPVKSIVYGMVGTVMLAVLGAILTLIIRGV